MNPKTVIKLVLVVDDEEKTTYTVTRMVTAPELNYLQSVADEGLNCMVDAILAAPQNKGLK